MRHRLTSVSVHLADNRLHTRLFTAFLAFFVFALGLYFHSAIPLLGDGSLRANEVTDGRLWHPTEFLDFLIHGLLYQHIFMPAGIKATLVYRFVSVLSGVAFVIGVVQLARYVSKSKMLLLIVTHFSTGVVVLFFGYVESYSIAAALLPFLVLVGLRATVGDSSRWTFVALYCLGAATHLSLGVMFAPAVVLVLLRVQLSDPRKIQRLKVGLPILLAAGTTGAYLLGVLGVDIVDRNLLPLVAIGNGQSAVLSADHGLGVLNWLLLSALPFIGLLPLMVGSGEKTGGEANSREIFALWILMPAAFFLLFFNPMLGPARDWDLFALPAFVLVAGAVILVQSRRKAGVPFGILSVDIVALAVIAAFIGINSSEAKAVARFGELVAQADDRNSFQEYALLYNHASNYPTLQKEAVRFAGLAWNAPPRNAEDSAYIGTKLVQEYIRSGNQSGARGIIGTLIESDTTELNNYLLLRDYIQRWGSKQQLLNVADRIRSLFPDDARAQMEAGVIYLQAGEMSAGGRALQRAHDLESDDPLILVNLGNYHLANRNLDDAMMFYGHTLYLDSSNFEANFGLAMGHYYLGENRLARRYLARADSLAVTQRHRLKVGELRQRLSE